MKKYYSFLSIGIFILLLSGCVSLSSNGEMVRVVGDMRQVKDCKLLGDITAEAIGEDNVQMCAKNAAAADLGGDVVLSSYLGDPDGFWYGLIGGKLLKGQVYSCSGKMMIGKGQTKSCGWFE
ncbi:MAG: hypothetical protein HQM14_05860 [SAR324 cluster bacterium]|nr:hypothetical protein [SAR324 cluster bacterium]